MPPVRRERPKIGVTRGVLAFVVAAAALALPAACDPYLGLTSPATRALENGAANTLTAARSFEIAGSYRESATKWSIDLQVVRPASEHVIVSGSDAKLEAVVIEGDAFFRGQPFLAAHLGSDPLTANFAKAVGNAWWKGAVARLPQLPDFTDGAAFRQAFLGPAANRRFDKVPVDGIDAVELSGRRGDVYIAAQPPHRLLRVRTRSDVAIDGITDADLRYSNFDRDFQIVAPTEVIDFANLSTLPPVYTVVSVDTSGCGSPCVVSALLKNLGGLTGARAPSTVKFAVTDPVSGGPLGSCQAVVRPDVGYNATTAVSCTIPGLDGQQVNAAVVTATADNPGHA